MHKIIFLPIGSIIILIILFFSLKISVINCSVAENNCRPEIYQKLENVKGKNLITINLEQILNSEDFASETLVLNHFNKKFPGQISIFFNEEEVLYLFIDNDQHTYVSKYGKILSGNQNKTSLPVIKNNFNIEKNHSIIKKLLKNSQENNFIVESIEWNSQDEINIYIKNKPMIITDASQLNSNIEALNLIINSREIKDFSQPIEEIDLRFALPVLRTREEI